MKIKRTLSPLQLAVTLFMCLFLLHPSRACVAAPDPCLSKPVPINQVTNIIQVNHDPVIQKEEDGKLLAPVIFFVIILAVFSWIIYQIIKMLDKVIPPPDKQPDPPPNSGDTNLPPIVINPSHGPGPVTATLVQKSLIVTSKTPSWGTINCYDIRALNYRADLEKFPTAAYYDSFWSTEMQVTTNMVDWEDSHYRVDCYVNSTYGAVCYAYFHYNTNWWNCYYTSTYVASNHMAPAWFNLSDRPYQPNQYFKLNPK